MNRGIGEKCKNVLLISAHLGYFAVTLFGSRYPQSMTLTLPITLHPPTDYCKGRSEIVFWFQLLAGGRVCVS